MGLSTTLGSITMRILYFSLVPFLFSLLGCSSTSPTPVAEASESPAVAATQSSDPYEQNKQHQVQMSELTLQAVVQMVGTEKPLPVRAAYFGKDLEKVKWLAATMNKRGYNAAIEPAVDSPGEYHVTVQVPPMKMELSSVQKWVAEMCDLGSKQECMFDGWQAELGKLPASSGNKSKK